MKTLQDIYDEVATKMIQQGKPAWGDGIICAYINREGKKCAVGCLFSDEDATELENKYRGESCTTFMDFIIKKLELNHMRRGQVEDLLIRLQQAHDDPANSKNGWHEKWNEKWFTKMEEIADEHGLDSSILQQGVK